MNRNVIYKHYFVITRVGNDYIIRNTHKPFKDAHSHQKRLCTCIALAVLIKNKKLPKNRTKHFLESLIRLSDDDEYTSIIKALLKVKAGVQDDELP